MVERPSGGTWSNAAEDRIDLVDPDPSWLRQFEAEAAALLAVLPPVQGFRVEHFGSTAVPGIRAKPVIDILVIHPEPRHWPRLVDPVASLGYIYWAENPRTDRMFFVKGMPPVRLASQPPPACKGSGRRGSGARVPRPPALG